MTSQQLVALRHRLGMSQSEIANAIGTTGRHAKRRVRAWEKGLEDIPPDAEKRLRNLEPEA